MDLRDRLRGLSHPVLVETVYLLGRYLTKGLSQASFMRQVESDVHMAYSDQALVLVVELIAKIEAAEGVKIPELPEAKRFAYAAKIDAVLWETIKPHADPAKVEATLAALRA